MLKKFTSNDAIKVGLYVIEKAKEMERPIGVEVYFIDRVVFSFLDTRLSKDKANWLRRKRNTVLNFGQSCFKQYEKLKGNEAELESKYGLDLKDYTLTPGGIPIILDGVGIVGALCVTGLLPNEDHELATDALEYILQLQTGA